MRMIYILFSLFLFLSAMPGIAYSQNPGKENFIQIILDPYRDSVAQEDYAISVILEKDGKITTASIGRAAPLESFGPDEVYGIGSITKTFTAVLVMQEIEKGNLKLDDKISKYFPKNRNVVSQITIEDLASAHQWAWRTCNRYDYKPCLPGSGFKIQSC